MFDSDIRSPSSSPVKLKRYDELDVFKLAYTVSLEIHKATLEWPKIEQYGGIADQLRRSSKSTCANIAEGSGKRFSNADERHYLSIALGSAEESKLWVRFAIDLGYLSSATGVEWDDAFCRIAQMLSVMRKGKS